MAGTLTWNANGTLSKLAVSDAFNASGTQTCKYGDPSASVAGYDDLARLISANCGSVWSQSFSYDPFGNLTKSGTSAWMPGYNQSNNRYTLAGTTYDAAGNLLNDTFHSYTWNVYGRPATIDGTTTLTYDANDVLIEKGVSGAYSEYEYGPTGKTCTMNGTTQVQCITPLPGGASLARGPETIWHPDWLGSPRLGSSPINRTITFDRAFAPFGEQYDTIAGGTSNLAFTGLTQDSVSGEYDTPARLLHPGQGRWISPDPLGMGAADPLNPQSWNLYAYVDNDPLNATDPTGTLTCPDGTQADSCVVDTYVETPLVTTLSINQLDSQSLKNLARRLNQALQDATNAAQQFLSAPRNPGCMAGSMASGSGIGLGVGGLVGTLGYAGGSVGLGTQYGGMQLGMAAGATAGYVYGMFACRTGGGGGGSGGGGDGGSTAESRWRAALAKWKNIPDRQKQLLDKWLGPVQGKGGAPGPMPPDLSRDTIEAYRDVAQAAIGAGRDGVGSQAARLQVISRVLGNTP